MWLIERCLARVAGVESAQMNVATERLNVRWNPAACKPSAIIAALRAVGYAAYPYEALRHGAAQEKARKRLFRQLFVAGLAMMQVMMYALPAYIAEDGTMDADMHALMRWASLLLTAPAVLYSAQPFFIGAWRSLMRPSSPRTRGAPDSSLTDDTVCVAGGAISGADLAQPAARTRGRARSSAPISSSLGT